VAREMDEGAGLPDFSWLYKHPKAFRESPNKFVKRCSWCSETFWIMNAGYRVCPRCDMSEGM
jgi:hypothetical protein